MKEKFKYLIPIILITILVFPKPAFAFIGTGIFDYFETSLGGVEELSGPVAAFILVVFLYYVVGLGALFISCSLLQLVLKNLSFLSIIKNPMVLSGWSFVAGITNMFFILIFVFIALATILKIETLAAKKLLPKLLLVALLVNFSLIFVGVMIDVSNIFYATIIGGDTDLIPDIFSVLTGSGEDIMVTIIAMIAVLLIAFIVPFISPFAQFGLVVLIVATGFIGQLLIWLVQGMMFFLMSGILITFVFLFTARIFVLQLLAMVAPIAFLCSVLPQTKKYWDDWLKMVVEWNTFGVVTLLFLVVGLRGANALLPAGGSAGLSFSQTTLFWGTLPGYLTYYFFLFVYLVSLLYFSQKYSPQMASMLISQAKSMGGMIYAKGLKPFGRAAKPAVQKVGRWAGKKVGGGLAKFGEKQRLRGKERLKDLEGKKGLGSWLRRRGGKLRTATASRLSIAGSRMVVGAGESETRAIEEAKKKTKGGTKKRQSFELQNAIAKKDWNAALGTAEAMMEDKNLSEAEAKGILGKTEYKRLVRRSKESGRKDIARYNLGRAFQIMEPEKWEEAEKLESENKKDEADKLRRETMGELFDKVIDPNKMDQVSDDSFKDEYFVKAFVDRAKGSHASQVSIHKSRGILDRIQNEIDERGVIQTIKDNPTLGKWLGTNAATKAGLSLPELKKDDEKYLQDHYKKEMEKENKTEKEYYDENFKKVMKEVVPVTRKTVRKEDDKKKREYLRDIKDDPQKLFNTYYAKETPNRVKEYIKDYLSRKDITITLPPEVMVKKMDQKKEEIEKKLRKEVGDEKAEVILKKAIGAWKEDLSKGKGLELTKERINEARKSLGYEEKEPRWKKEFLSKKENYEKETAKFENSIDKSEEEIAEREYQLKKDAKDLSAHRAGDHMLSKYELKEKEKRKESLPKEISSLKSKIESFEDKIKTRQEALDKINKEIDSWRIKEVVEEDKETEELLSSFGGAIKFLSPEIKKQVKEGRALRDKLKVRLTEFDKVLKEKKLLEKEVDIRSIDLNEVKEKDIPYKELLGTHTRKRRRIEKMELTDRVSRLRNIIRPKEKKLKREIDTIKQDLIAKKRIVQTKRGPEPPSRPPSGPPPPRPSMPPPGGAPTPIEITVEEKESITEEKRKERLFKNLLKEELSRQEIEKARRGLNKYIQESEKFLEEEEIAEIKKAKLPPEIERAATKIKKAKFKHEKGESFTPEEIEEVKEATEKIRQNLETYLKKVKISEDLRKIDEIKEEIKERRKGRRVRDKRRAKILEQLKGEFKLFEINKLIKEKNISFKEAEAMFDEERFNERWKKYAVLPKKIAEEKKE